MRQTLGRSIDLGRRYAKSGHKEDLYEALRLLGTGLHCLEDYAAHSNYTELSLIELGEKEVFPHVGRNTAIQIEDVRGRFYPIVTGTFGGVDFFHSVLGEVSDKTAQSEVQSLEGVIDDSQTGGRSQSILQDLLSKIPSGMLNDTDDQNEKMDGFKAQAEDAKNNKQDVSPRKPEEWARFLNDVQKQVYPVLEWHDGLIKAIDQAIEKIPVLPDLIEQVQEQLNIFVFSILAPYVLPIIKQVKTELLTGSSEVIQSSKDEQHIVFNDDNSSNPTHSMLSKDHFSNVLNEPAGRIASQIVKWTVPQIMECWDNEDVNIARTLDRIVTGIFHHPALRDDGRDGARDVRAMMFGTVEKWWSEKSDRERRSLREQLSREGVLHGKNHKEGVHDTGHGCGKPISLPNQQGKSSSGGSGHGNSGGGHKTDTSGIEKAASKAAGGGALGGLVGGLVGGIGSMVMGDDDKKERRDDGGREHKSSSHGRSERHDDDDYRRHESRHSGRSEQHQSGYGNDGSRSRMHASGHGGGYGSSESRYESSGSRPPYGSSSGYGHSDRSSNERVDEYGQGGYGRSERHHGSGYGHSGRSSNERVDGYGQSGYGQSGYGSGYGQNNYGSGYGHSGRSSNERVDGYGQSGYGHSGYGQSAHGSGYGHSGRSSNERLGDGYRQSGYGSGYGHSGRSSNERLGDGYGQSGYGSSERHHGSGHGHSGHRSERHHGERHHHHSHGGGYGSSSGGYGY